MVDPKVGLLLSEYMPAEIPIYAVCAQTIYTALVVRAFIEYFD